MFVSIASDADMHVQIRSALRTQLTSENIHAVLVDNCTMRMTRGWRYSSLCHNKAPLVFLEVVGIQIYRNVSRENSRMNLQKP